MSSAGPFAVVEAIASRDRNNLYLTSSFLTDERRYRAFCAFYALMRVVDDRIDALPSRESLPLAQRSHEQAVLEAWQSGVSQCYQGGGVTPSVVQGADHPDARSLFEAFARALLDVRPPQRLWDDFFRSMRWDLEHDRIDTWQEFVCYTEGASVAPTTIYLFILTTRPTDGHASVPEGFDIMKCGRELGQFAYLAHIARDTAEDLRTGEKGLVYYTREDMKEHGVSEEMLFRDLRRGQASRATRGMVAEILSRAKALLSEGRASMRCLSGRLEPDCEFVLELIVTVYDRVIDKLVACSCDPMGARHRLTPEEKQSIFTEVARRVGYEPTGGGLHRS